MGKCPLKKHLHTHVSAPDLARIERAARLLNVKVGAFVRAAAVSVASQTLHPAAVEYVKPTGEVGVLPLTTGRQP